MNFLGKNFQKLEHALRATYQAKESMEVGSRWKLEVMRDIRRLGPLNEKANAFFFVNQFVWRFATVACMIALILSVYVGFTGFNPTDEIANVFLGDPVKFTLTQVLGDQ